MIDSGTTEKALGGRGEPPSFDDVVGQAALKRALLAVATDDDLDGLLIQGEKGTAKSTAVRALSGLLPARTAVADCAYGCPPEEPARQCVDCRGRADPPTERRPTPVVDLPLGATRDRIVGTLSVADALAGDATFDPGLLARANRGFLYVDEVNLLDDHLVDVLLDAAARGVNRVERDGVSVTHPAEFTLVGTMNPEEGDLRPQLRDRFALQATVEGLRDLDDRVAVIDRALGRGGGHGGTDHGTALVDARERLAAVDLPGAFAEEIAELCRDAGVDGHRADIATARAARAFAALDGRTTVIEPDVRRAAGLALPHRLRSTPFEDAPDADALVDDHFGDGTSEEGGTDDEGGAEGDESGERAVDGDAGTSTGTNGTHETDASDDREPESSTPREGRDDDSGGERRRESDGTASERPRADGGDAPASGSGSGVDEGGADEGGGSRDGGDPNETEEATPLLPGQSRAAVGDGAAPDLSPPETVTDRKRRGGGRASAAPRAGVDGPRVRTERAGSNDAIDAAASVRAATSRGAGSVDSRDLRQSVRADDAATLVLFVVDASASMRPAMRAAKGTVLELLKGAYRERDAVGFVAFAGTDADVLLPPTDSVTLAARHLKELPTGDRTPLPAGLRTARTVLARADPAASVVVLVTDGRANVAAGSPVAETRAAAERLAEHDPQVVVVDAGDGDHGGRGGLVDLVADATNGERIPLNGLSAEQVDAVARQT